MTLLRSAWAPASRLARYSAVVGLLCCLAPAGADELPGWEALLYCRKPEGNLHLAPRWYPDRGFRWAVVSRTEPRGVVLTLHAGGMAAEYLPGRGNGNGAIPIRFYPNDGLARVRSRAELTLKFRENDWSLYLGDALVARLQAPFQLPADVHVPEGDSARMAEGPVFRPVPVENFASDFMIEEGAPNQLYPWRIETGNWRIHTVMQDALTRPESDVDRIRKVPLTPDKSPNFYSLKGGGADESKGTPVESLITTGYDFFDDYEFAAALQVNRGEAGLVFYHRGEGDGDFYAFTIDMGTDSPDSERCLRLWQAREGRRKVLARAGVPLYREQWYMPRVRLLADEIVCFLDEVEVMRVRHALPPGGKIGLYARSEDEIRFDDVKLLGYDHIPLRNVGEVRYQLLHREGTFFRQPTWWRRGTPDDQVHLTVRPQQRDQILVLGRPHNRNTAFRARFAPRAESWSLGLVCGFRSLDKPYYRFVVDHRPDGEAYRVERVRRGHVQVLDTWDHAVPRADAPRPVELECDATESGRLRLLKDGTVVLLLPVSGPLEGGAGIFVGAGTAAEVPELHYDFTRNRYLEQENKNPVFKEDSFMRHWAAPEGQWIAGEGGLLWHKGDFLGDFSVRLPCIDGSALHVAVPDGATEGPVRALVAGSTLRLEVHPTDGSPAATYEAALTAAEEGQTVAALSYDLHREGYWVWLTVDGETRVRHRLTEDLTGTRCRVSGMTLAHLGRSRITRANVIDDFFTESPYRWMVNGGDWQIINRFQCTPSWSHMVGESADGLAALWLKQEFTGDLTLEFYAGTRQGWYERAGDLNCTVMAATTSPNTGYTVTCTEFDQNLSQNWTTLYRNGHPMARSDKYLVPRRRAGMVRRFLNPLIADGRPIHGAWYYIKLRKIGNRVEYYFDNELIFAVDDPEPLDEGLVSIWTFMQSMTVAQVKIAFQSTRPRTFPVTPLRRNPPPGRAGEAPPADESPRWRVTDRGFPVDNLDPAYWNVTDPVGHARLLPSRMNAASLRVVNRLGSGNMLAGSSLPPVPLAQLAGWRFRLKRSPGACLNLHYSLGAVDAKGNYKPSRFCFHRISGDAFSEGEFTLTGQTEVPPVDNVDRSGGHWETVTAWIPTRVRSGDDAGKGTMVRLEGIGNRQPSPILCGVGGNQPGDSYAIRQLTPIFYGPPQIALGEDTPPLHLSILDRPSGNLLGTAPAGQPPTAITDLFGELS
ncbi:MAG: hypothetical protein JXR77_16225, partial [Lentisphaeria bacterium]|nr:hypothetical protein [Lentisphaeria bacterium]